MNTAEARRRLLDLVNGPDSGLGMAARLVLTDLALIEQRRDAVVRLCREVETVDAARVLRLLGEPSTPAPQPVEEPA